MKAKSKYDNLHDQYHTILTEKAGTRYERLASFLFKSLNKSGTIIHDLRLIGETDVKHQIDVTIQTGKSSRRYLVECKDFDISGKKVGLSIIRNFWSVVDDIKPDGAYVVTTEGFTRDARKFAKARGIKLAVLREFRDKDWEGRVRTIQLDFQAILVSPNPTVDFLVSESELIEKLQYQLVTAGLSNRGARRCDAISVWIDGERHDLFEYVDQQIGNRENETPGSYSIVVSMREVKLQIIDLDPVPIEGIRIRYEVFVHDETYEITSNRIARLLLTGDAEVDYILFGDEIRSMAID